MFYRHPMDFPERPIIWSQRCLVNGSPVGVPWASPFRTFEYFFYLKNRYVTQGLLLLKNNFFKKSSVSVLVPWEFPLASLGNLLGTSPVSRVSAGVSYDNLLDCNVYHPKKTENPDSFIPLKYSLTDLITQHLQENNPLFYDLWSIYHSRALPRNSDKKVNFLVFFKKCKF